MANTTVRTEASIDVILEHHKALFQEGLGTVMDYSAKLQVRSDVQPKFYKPRPLQKMNSTA